MRALKMGFLIWVCVLAITTLVSVGFALWLFGNLMSSVF